MTVTKEEGRKPLNPLYEGASFIFKTTGEVRRLKSAPRFTRKLSLWAGKTANELKGVEFLTVADNTTVYILSRAQTALLHSEETIIEAMILNGWSVEPTTRANMELIPAIRQGELL